MIKNAELESLSFSEQAEVLAYREIAKSLDRELLKKLRVPDYAGKLELDVIPVLDDLIKKDNDRVQFVHQHTGIKLLPYQSTYLKFLMSPHLPRNNRGTYGSPFNVLTNFSARGKSMFMSNGYSLFYRHRLENKLHRVTMSAKEHLANTRVTGLPLLDNPFIYTILLEVLYLCRKSTK